MSIDYSVFLCVLLCLAFAGWRLRQSLQVPVQPLPLAARPENLANFCRPMERLLSDSDFSFLASHGSVSTCQIRKMRAERRRIFRQYLHAVQIDFSAILTELRFVMVTSDSSRGDLASTIFKARLVFLLATTAIQIRLILHACGFYGVAVSPRLLVSSLSEIQRALNTFAPSPTLSLS